MVLEKTFKFNINEVMIQTQKHPSLNKQAVLREKKVSRTVFEARKMAGSATYKQRK